MTTRIAPARVGGLAGAAVLALGAAWAPAAAAPRAADSPAPPAAEAPAEGDGDTLTWAVGPADKDGKVRPIFEYAAEPGDVITDTLRVKVIGDKSMTFDVYGSDAFLTEEGVFDVLPAAKPSRDIGSWVDTGRDRLSVRGDETVEIPFVLTVPGNATPGDHIGGIVTSVSTLAEAGDAGSLRLDRRLGARIYLRVAGTLSPAVTVGPPKVSYKGSVNPFGGRTEVTYTITNSGNTRVQASRAVKASGLLGGSTGARDLPELLPGSVLTFTETVSGPRIAGPAGAEVTVAPRDPLQGELPTSAIEAAGAAAGTWALPLSQLVLVVLLAGGGAATVVLRRRGRTADPTGAGGDPRGRPMAAGKVR